MLTPAQLAATVESIAAVQLSNGMIPWFPGGHADPWNHVEAAMALTLGGRITDAERAYGWLAATQHDNGSWFNYYLDGAIEDYRLDTNVIAYVATGVLQHFRTTGDRGFLHDLWPVVERAVTFVLSLQQPDGEILWSIEPDGVTPGRFALLTGSSSVYFSLRCAVAVAEHLGRERPEWELAAGNLASAIAYRPERFEPKERWAMDWYYPVLTGAVDRRTGQRRIADKWDEFVMDGLGVRCVSDRPWVTAAETAECAMALCTIGREDDAAQLIEWAQHMRDTDGSYWTGCVHPQCVRFPGGERTTYTSAAIVLAYDVLTGTSATARLFRGEDLPVGLVADQVRDPT